MTVAPLDGGVGMDGCIDDSTRQVARKGVVRVECRLLRSAHLVPCRNFPGLDANTFWRTPNLSTTIIDPGGK